MKPFDPIEPERILAQDELFMAALDKFPVSPGHALIIVKRLVSRLQELTPEEKAWMIHWLDWCQGHLDRTRNRKPTHTTSASTTARRRARRSANSTIMSVGYRLLTIHHQTTEP
jgi:diadenosine tetraphosphate (Ap4A) HIT family hydrolase